MRGRSDRGASRENAAQSDEARLAEDGLPTIAQVIARHGLAPTRALGQNFLLDLSLTRRIARTALSLGPAPADTPVLEIGPGPGGLTRALLIEGASRVIAVERDRRCLPALAEIAERWPGRLTVVSGDALALDPVSLIGGEPVRIAANLPYNIGTELLVRWLRDRRDAAGRPLGQDSLDHSLDRGWWRSLAVMLQREVAERAAASVDSKAYGRLAALTGWRANASIAFEVSPKAFTPPPKVVSAILTATPRGRPGADCALEALEAVTEAAFGQRRKMVRSSLKALAAQRGVEISAWLADAGVAPESRAEVLDLEQLAALARTLPSHRS